MKNKKIYLEFIRIVACFFVIVNHTVSYVFWDYVPGGKTWCVSVFSFFLCKFSVPVFLMISGIVLLGKEDSYEKLFKRIKKIVIIIIMSSMLYYINECIRLHTIFGFLTFVQRMIERPFSNCLWYLYMYLGILLILPVLQKMTKHMTKRDYEYILISGFFILSVCPVIAHCMEKNGVSSLVTGSMLGVYVLMVILGYYLEKYICVKETMIKWLLLIVIGETCVNVALSYHEWRVLIDNNKLTSPNDYLFYSNQEYINVLILSICVFLLLKSIWIKYEYKFSANVKKIVSYIGGLTLGIYVMGDFWIEMFLPLYYRGCARLHPMICVVILQAFVFIVGMIVTMILKRICKK